MFMNDISVVLVSHMQNIYQTYIITFLHICVCRGGLQTVTAANLRTLSHRESIVNYLKNILSIYRRDDDIF